eukprot:1509449-Amphidinium_carterae.1
MLVNRLQVRAHLLVTSDLNNPDFNKAAKILSIMHEEYYRNVYIDIEFTANTNAMKDKYNKGQGKYGKKRQERYTDYTGGFKGNTTPYSKRISKGKCQSRPYYVEEKGKIHSTTLDHMGHATTHTDDQVQEDTTKAKEKTLAK